MVLYDAFSSSQGIASIVIGFYTEIDANDYRGLHTVWVRELEAIMGNLQSQPRNETFWFSTTNLHTNAGPRTVNIIYMNKASFLVVK